MAVIDPKLEFNPLLPSVPLTAGPPAPTVIDCETAVLTASVAL
jgi:hypothetical protein